MQRAKERFPETDGIFATSDILAARIQSASRNLFPEWGVPLIGFDGVDVSEYCNISTVAQPVCEMGQLAVKLLIDRINGEEVPESSILPVSFIRRGSSGYME